MKKISPRPLFFALAFGLATLIIEVSAWAPPGPQTPRRRRPVLRPSYTQLLTTTLRHPPLYSRSRVVSLATPVTYELTREVFVRSLGFVYFVAFLVAKKQNKELIGENGLTPMGSKLSSPDKIHWPARPIARLSQRMGFNQWLDCVAMAGLIVSAATTLLPGNFACVPTLFALWALYHSLLFVGGPWYGFGWESQLLEAAHGPRRAQVLPPGGGLQRTTACSGTSAMVTNCGS